MLPYSAKFSQMVVFEDFVEIISRIRCLNHVHAAHIIIWAWHTSKFYLIRTVTPLSALELAVVSKAMPTLKVSLWRASLVDSAACCPSTLLHVKTVVYV